MGFEPTTASLEGWNSTTELRPPRYLFFSKIFYQSKQITARKRPRPFTLHKKWWAGKDSNLGSRWQQIYSLPPLSTRVPAHFTFTIFGSLPLSHQRLREIFNKKGGMW